MTVLLPQHRGYECQETLADLRLMAAPASLGEFYRKVTGWKVTYSDDTFAYLGDGGPIQLGFQRVDGYRAPGWPDAAKHARLTPRTHA